MSKETIWFIIAGAAALLGVPLIYLGLESSSTLLAAGFALFGAGMLVTPLMRLRAGNS